MFQSERAPARAYARVKHHPSVSSGESPPWSRDNFHITYAHIRRPLPALPSCPLDDKSARRSDDKSIDSGITQTQRISRRYLWEQSSARTRKLMPSASTARCKTSRCRSSRLTQGCLQRRKRDPRRSQRNAGRCLIAPRTKGHVHTRAHTLHDFSHSLFFLSHVPSRSLARANGQSVTPGINYSRTEGTARPVFRARLVWVGLSRLLLVRMSRMRTRARAHDAALLRCVILSSEQQISTQGSPIGYFFIRGRLSSPRSKFAHALCLPLSRSVAITRRRKGE